MSSFTQHLERENQKTEFVALFQILTDFLNFCCQLSLSSKFAIWLSYNVNTVVHFSALTLLF